MLQITEDPIKLRITEQGHTPEYAAPCGTDVSAGLPALSCFGKVRSLEGQQRQWPSEISTDDSCLTPPAWAASLSSISCSMTLLSRRSHPIWEHAFVRREPHHLSSVENLELSRIKSAIIKCCALKLLGQLIHTALSIYWPRHTQEEGEGPFFHSGNICTLNRIPGLFVRDFLTCPPNLFPKACHDRSPGRSPTWWETVGTVSKSDSKWDSAEWHWPCSHPRARGHRSQCFCQSMSLSHPQERRYSVCTNTKCQGTTEIYRLHCQAVMFVQKIWCWQTFRYLIKILNQLLSSLSSPHQEGLVFLWAFRM